MTAWVSGIAAGVLVAVSFSTAMAGQCDSLERHAEIAVDSLAMVKDQSGAFRELTEEARIGVRQCPSSARLWYLLARSVEVSEGSSGRPLSAESGPTRKIVLDALAHAPRSAPITTIAARIDGTPETARRAYDLDKGYRPAHRALALALAKAGQTSEALALLNFKDTSSADRITRARVLQATGRLRDAASEARRALDHPLADPFEPSLYAEIFRDGNEVLGLVLLAEGRSKEALRALSLAAEMGSTAAAAELARR